MLHSCYINTTSMRVATRCAIWREAEVDCRVGGAYQRWGDLDSEIVGRVLSWYEAGLLQSRLAHTENDFGHSAQSIMHCSTIRDCEATQAQLPTRAC